MDASNTTWRTRNDQSAWYETDQLGEYFCFKCKAVVHEITPYCGWCGRRMINVEVEGDRDKNLHTEGDRRNER